MSRRPRPRPEVCVRTTLALTTTARRATLLSLVLAVGTTGLVSQSHHQRVTPTVHQKTARRAPCGVLTTTSQRSTALAEDAVALGAPPRDDDDYAETTSPGTVSPTTSETRTSTSMIAGTFATDADETTNEWRTKYMVEKPRTIDPKEALQLTKFDKFKLRYMGRYNEVDASKADMSYAEFGAIVMNQQLAFQTGDKVTGRVEKFDDARKRAFVEIGAKTFAVLPLREASINAPAPGEHIEDFVEVGDSYEFEIVADVRDDGGVIVSLKKIAREKAWDKLATLYAEDPVIEGLVVSVNRGGAIVLVEGLHAFCPGSHVMGYSAEKTEELVGHNLQVKFLEVNKESQKLVVSHKRAVLEHAMDDVERGSVVAGTVSAVKPYGCFVELEGGLSGLLHISQISYDRVTDINSALEPGVKVKCMIIDYDKSNGRIALSTKTLEPEPGDMLRDPQRVYDNADETAEKYRQRVEAERIAREKAAQEMVLGLGDDLIGGVAVSGIPASSPSAAVTAFSSSSSSSSAALDDDDDDGDVLSDESDEDDLASLDDLDAET